MLTIDVEDWFQVENFKPWIPFSTWDQCELRVERNVHRILDLFDSIDLHPQPFNDEYSPIPSTHKPTTINPTNPTNPTNSINSTNPTNSIYSTNPKATFFILGWIAERLPHLVREIKKRGHEVASHGYNHELCDQIPHNDLKNDLLKSKKLLEDIIGEPVYGYRAPNFSINEDILKIIKACGYLYDSSYNSFSLNDRYGKVDLSKYKNIGIATKLSENFYELPISNLNFNYPFSFQLSAMSSGQNDKKRFVLPLGGGGYFRLMPFHVFKYGVKSILNKGRDYLFYMHPWEIDPEQPRVREASKRYKFRHYINLDKTHSKLTRLIESFNQCRFINCKQYLEKRDLNGD